MLAKGVLGSHWLLLLSFVEDISSVSNVFSSVLFADDTTLLYSSNNLQDLSATVNNELSNIMQWLNADRLSLNTEKTNFMIFRPRGKNEVCPTIHICGAEIQEVDSAKFLGRMVDNELNWMEHIKCISRKIAKDIGIIIKARLVVDVIYTLSFIVAGVIDKSIMYSYC